MWIFSCAHLKNTCSKVTIKKLDNMHVCMCSSKYSMPSFFCFYCWLWSLSPNQYSFSTFNFEQVFLSSIWNNVLKTLFQDLFHLAIYHCTQLKKIATSLNAYYDINILWTYVLSLNLLWESQTNNHRFIPLFDLLYHRYFPEI